MINYLIVAGLSFACGALAFRLTYKDRLDFMYDKGYRDAKEIEQIFKDAGL